MKKALLSISNKNGISEFAKKLQAYDYELLATQGTAAYLQKENVPVTELSKYTGVSEMLSGKVKSLHPKIFAGLLALPEQYEEIQSKGIDPIQLVVVNFYPEEIDIGGVALLRAAAKNYQNVLPICDEDDYEGVLEYLSQNKNEIHFRKRLAAKAFAYTAQYDAKMAQSLSEEEFPQNLILSFSKAYDLHYGENPEQRAAFYVRKEAAPRSLLKGEKLSYNNLLDSDAAIKLVREFSEPSCAIIKHTNPCGAASSTQLKKAFELAYQCDSLSAYGGIVAFNRKVDEEAALALKEMFFDVIIAPDYDEKALDTLKLKKKLRILQLNALASRYSFHPVTEGILYQTISMVDFDKVSLKCLTKRKPSSDQVRDLLFAAKVNRHVKSNSVILAKNESTVGIGAGQMSRLDSTTMALLKAKENAKKSVLSSDGFFPFPDSILEAARAGVEAIIQPGGSMRDQEIIDACDAQGIAMVFTGIRTFKH